MWASNEGIPLFRRRLKQEAQFVVHTSIIPRFNGISGV
ncbi:hypothetical protein MA6G0728R_1821 [Mycobacteroides abscessus 6G-0728-R]|uniref:Uncharacterized protein n=1 Tax=Mycobacteroides abscessus 1948 TaxID=1299323 RepID=A0A829QDL1_9MYCO|nr:hypothetical protein MA6G0125R_0858 [Mycobacteroides abscessus 6G-0125-R]EIU49186.1 hypothetical protein MA6G0125S_1832 [Mycobacteroides abscessus 6G-0125-S]EIU59870.1 hypothetical protein MA6G0728S_0721 [Mycobacteroides abscessus 6G-0728-S]EIU64766.1 hypothetical protein MA6G1108_1819 [Mycobacteroides abscessus 6G-1108]EIU96904.1 hypothetical protein MA6G0212_1883 [Mycobacteroides abscessus 6G-0212]EIV00034.1 hypothetical protein MA6G0728R_1821 [Mycobacteroides abscessus 6G-0728-R]EIV2774